MAADTEYCMYNGGRGLQGWKVRINSRRMIRSQISVDGGKAKEGSIDKENGGPQYVGIIEYNDAYSIQGMHAQTRYFCIPCVACTTVFLTPWRQTCYSYFCWPTLQVVTIISSLIPHGSGQLIGRVGCAMSNWVEGGSPRRHNQNTLVWSGPAAALMHIYRSVAPLSHADSTAHFGYCTASLVTFAVYRMCLQYYKDVSGKQRVFYYIGHYNSTLDGRH